MGPFCELAVQSSSPSAAGRSWESLLPQTEQDVPDPCSCPSQFSSQFSSCSLLSLSLSLFLSLQEMCRTLSQARHQDVVSDLVKKHSLGVIVAPLFSSWRQEALLAGKQSFCTLLLGLVLSTHTRTQETLIAAALHPICMLASSC